MRRYFLFVVLAAAFLAGCPKVHSVTANWNPSAGASYYDVYRSTGGTFSLYATNVVSTEYVDYGVVSGATYSYEIEAVNGAGPSAPSAAKSITVP